MCRRLAEGKPYRGEAVDAVLLNSTEWGGIQRLSRLKGKLKELYRSPLLQGPQVVLFGAEDSPGDEGALRQALLNMAGDPEAAPLLRSLRVTGFKPPQVQALQEIVKRYDEEAP